MNVEIWLAAEDSAGNGGDFVQSENGDLLLAFDTPASADASNQRIGRLLTTNPRLTDANGTPISTPGDLFHPDYGAGEPALVDAAMTTAMLAGLQARILGSLKKDPTVAQTPAPVVTATQLTTLALQVTVKAKTVEGNPIDVTTPAS